MYDALIIGARCAGSPTGMLLARKGYRVLIVDRDTFPSDTLSTSYMQIDAVQRLHKWGLHERLLATDTPELKTIHAAFNAMEMDLPTGPVPTLAPRRTVLDSLLVDAARDAGAEVREGCSVLEVLKNADGAVTGVRLRKDGVESVEEARIVIGADGRNSVVAKAVDAPHYNETPGFSAGFYTFYSGFERDSPYFMLRGGHLIFVFPTNGDAAFVGFEAPYSNWEQVRADPDAYLQALVAEHAPAILERMNRGKKLDKFYGMGGRESYYRKPFGPGWALAGDAGYLKDPLLGEGVNDAFWAAEHLSEAIDAGFSGKRPLEEALAEYETRRNLDTAERYELTHALCQSLGSELPMELAGRFAASNQQRAMAAMAPAG